MVNQWGKIPPACPFQALKWSKSWKVPEKSISSLMGWDLLLVVSIGLKMSVHFLVHEALFPPKTGIVISEQTPSVYRSAFQSSLGILNSQFCWLTQICCTCSWLTASPAFQRSWFHTTITHQGVIMLDWNKRKGEFSTSVLFPTQRKLKIGLEKARSLN